MCAECGERYERPGYCARDGKALVETADLLLGSEIGRYRVARLLAEGGMGRVYLGVQPAIGSRVAIKVLGDATSTDLLDRFFAEARAVNMIRHESIVSVLDMAKLDDGRPYIVMEYIEGQTLGALVRSGGAPLGGIVQVMLEVLSALAAAHAIGIVHRDLKPDNVLVTGEGHAKVVDFGIAKLLPGLSQHRSPRTRTGALLGTPAYMAPEQISGSGNIDPRTDIYAAGIVFYEAVTGRAPFVGETLFDLMRMHLEVAPQPPRALRDDLPPSLEEVILQALAKDPARRFQSAAAMAQATQHAAADLRPEDWRSLSARSTIITGGRVATAHVSRPQRGVPTSPASPTPAEVAPPPLAAEPTRAAAPRGGRSVVPWIVGMVAAAAIAAVVTWIVAGRSRSEATTRTAPIASAAADAADVAPVEPAPDQAAGSAPPSGSARGGPVPAAAGGSAPRPQRPLAKQPATTPPAASPPPTTTAPPAKRTSIAIPADYDPKRFDPVAFLPKARALARQLYADARLTRFDFEPVRSDGRVDLTMPGDDRSYWFRSPSASKRPPDVPANLPVERPCMIYVDLEPTRVRAYVVSNEDCDDNLVRDPRCKLAAVWKQALAKGVPADHVAKIGWLFDEKWFFDTDLAGDGGGETTSFEDRCP